LWYAFFGLVVVAIVVVVAIQVGFGGNSRSSGVEVFVDHTRTNALASGRNDGDGDTVSDRTTTTTTTNNNNIHNKSITRIACIGDSITNTTHVKIRDRTKLYPHQLSDLLGPGYEVGNYGERAHTLSKNGRCRREGRPGSCSYWKTGVFEAARSWNPNIVTILLGTNDGRDFNWESNGEESFVGDYLDLIGVFAALPSRPKIYLGIPPPVVPRPGSRPGTPIFAGMLDKVINGDLRRLVPRVAQEAVKRFGPDVIPGKGVVDTWSALGGTEGYNNRSLTVDGCHPTEIGLAVVARAFAEAISSDSG